MPYNNVMSRDDVSALIPEELSEAMLSGAIDESIALSKFTRLPVRRNQARLPVLSALPTAYFVEGDTGLKQTSEANWANKYLNVEEIAVILPIPESVLEDTDTPIWDEVLPLCSQAIGRTADAAIFFGTDSPANWPADILTAVTAASNTATLETNTAAEGGIVGDNSDMLGLIEDGGFAASEGLASIAIRGRVRQARNSQGDRFGEVAISKDAVEIDGVTYVHALKGMWPTASGSPAAFAFDPAEFVCGLRQDIRFKVLTEAIIQDNSGNTMYNLAQQDMVALRMTMRLGWQVSNRINYQEPTEASRYPAGALLLP